MITIDTGAGLDLTGQPATVIDEIDALARTPLSGVLIMMKYRSVGAGFGLASALIWTGSLLATSCSATPTVSRTSDFLDSIGVNTHVEYTDSRYANMAQVIHTLQYVGITHVRDGALWHGNQGQASYGVLARTGVKFDLFFNRNLPVQIAEVQHFVATYPGSVDAIEGPNEVNNFPVQYLGEKGTAGAIAYQNALYQQVKADPVLNQIPVVNFTDWPNHAGQADYGNVHSYPKNGAQPQITLDRDISDETKVAAGAPLIATETGYHTLVDAPAKNGVPEKLQAIYIANLLFDNFSNHIRRTYIYELLDEFADPKNTEQEKHFGLFHTDYTPKLSANFLHNLHTILGDDKQPDGTPAPVAVEVSDGRYLVLSRSDGRHFILLWREPNLWDHDAKVPLPAPVLPVQIRFDRPRELATYSPIDSARPTRAGEQRTLTLSLAAEPVIIEF